MVLNGASEFASDFLFIEWDKMWISLRPIAREKLGESLRHGAGAPRLATSGQKVTLTAWEPTTSTNCYRRSGLWQYGTSWLNRASRSHRSELRFRKNDASSFK